MLSLQKSQSLFDLPYYRNGDLAAGRTFSSPFIPLQYFPALFSFNYASPDKPSFFSYLPSTFNSSHVSPQLGARWSIPPIRAKDSSF
jgi:hypothetical protein